MPRILFVSYTAEWTGPTNSLTLLLKFLRDQYEVAVLVPGEGLFTETLQREGIRYIALPDLSRGAIPAMRRLIRRERFDLVYANNTSGSSRNAMIASKLAFRPVINHVREMGWGKHWQTLGYLRLADAVIAVSKACATSVAPFVAKHKLHVVYNGIPVVPATVSREAARTQLNSEFGLQPDNIIITSVGHIIARKGHEYAVEAMAEIVKAVPCARLLLIGSLEREPEYVEKIRALIQEKNLNSYVNITGFKENALQLVRGADLFLHTALKEPHPRSVLEAMAAEIPGAAFSVDGVAETIINNVTGYLVPKGDLAGLVKAVVTLAKDPALQTTMGQKARQRVETHFSANVTAQQVARIIDNTLDKVK